MATKKNTTEETKVIYIKPMDERIMTVHIVGDTPLIVSNWTKKALQEMLDAQTGGKKTKKQKVAKNIWAECAQRLYWMDGEPDIEYSDWTQELYEQLTQGARFGFPATAFKEAAISAGIRGGFVKYKTELQGEFYIVGEGERQLVQINKNSENKIPTMREDNVRLAGIGRVADLRHRPQFEHWSADLVVKYDANGSIDPESIINLINLGGHKVGTGEWRTEKSGQYGTFHVESVE